MSAKWIYRIAWPVFITALIYYVAAILKPVLYFHMQQTPFLFTGEYLTRFLNRPGGLIQYFTQFIMQGFHSSWLGTVILLTILLLSAFLLRVLLKTVVKQNSLFWPFLLLLATLLILKSYYFPILVLTQLIFVILALIIVSRITFSRISGWITFVLLFLLVYYILGTGSSVVFATGSVILLMFKLPIREWYKAGIPIVTVLLLPWLSYKFIFNIAPSDAYFSFFPPLSILSKYIPGDWFYIFVFLVPLLIGIAGLYGILHERLPGAIQTRLNSFVVTLSLVFVSGVLSTFILKSNFDSSAKNIALCDYYNYHGNYEKTIDLALSTPDEYNVFINLAYNRAISKSGDFTERLLDYPQKLGSQILQPEILGSPVFMMASSDLYYDLGYISQAQHAAYGILAIEPDHPRAKMRLVQTNILLANPRAAQVYLNSLADGFHHKDFIEKHKAYMMDPNQIRNDPELSTKLELIPDNFAIPAQMKERLRDLILKNDANMLAWEYLEACHLLDHQLGDFMKDINGALKFYNFIPDIYGQAIIIYFFNEGKPGMEEYNISETAKTQFNEYLRVMAVSNSNKSQARDSLNFLSDTYMYYVNYISPKVTNAKVVQETY